MLFLWYRKCVRLLIYIQSTKSNADIQIIRGEAINAQTLEKESTNIYLQVHRIQKLTTAPESTQDRGTEKVYLFGDKGKRTNRAKISTKNHIQHMA